MAAYNANGGGARPPFEELAVLRLESGHDGTRESGRDSKGAGRPADVRREPWLSAEHRRNLEVESGLSPQIVNARGYRTVSTKTELRQLGFAGSQCNPPGLLIPIHSPPGEIVNYQFRPDLPRINDGRPVKYETPRGSRMTLDVHPFARQMLGDPSVPLFVTEGIRKGDALASRGLCAVALLGVWNWRGTNGQGGKVALPGWESIALNGRKVYIVFDSDVMTKPQVHGALTRLKSFLEVK